MHRLDRAQVRVAVLAVLVLLVVLAVVFAVVLVVVFVAVFVAEDFDLVQTMCLCFVYMWLKCFAIDSDFHRGERRRINVNKTK